MPKPVRRALAFLALALALSTSGRARAEDGSPQPPAPPAAPPLLAWPAEERDVRIPMRDGASLASCDRPDVDVSVRLCDTFPGGGVFLVGETIQRTSLRDGRASRPMKPGEPVSVVLRLPPHAWTFLPGHRATLLVTSGNWPRYERNPHTGAPAWDEATAVPVNVTVRVGPGDATLSLPLVER